MFTAQYTKIMKRSKKESQHVIFTEMYAVCIYVQQSFMLDGRRHILYGHLSDSPQKKDLKDDMNTTCCFPSMIFYYC